MLDADEQELFQNQSNQILAYDEAMQAANSEVDDLLSYGAEQRYQMASAGVGKRAVETTETVLASNPKVIGRFHNEAQDDPQYREKLKDDKRKEHNKRLAEVTAKTEDIAAQIIEYVKNWDKFQQRLDKARSEKSTKRTAFSEFIRTTLEKDLPLYTQVNALDTKSPSAVKEGIQKIVDELGVLQFGKKGKLKTILESPLLPEAIEAENALKSVEAEEQGMRAPYENAKLALANLMREAQQVDDKFYREGGKFDEDFDTKTSGLNVITAFQNKLLNRVGIKSVKGEISSHDKRWEEATKRDHSFLYVPRIYGGMSKEIAKEYSVRTMDTPFNREKERTKQQEE